MLDPSDPNPTTGSKEENKHKVRFRDWDDDASGEDEWTSLDQEWWDINDIADDLATELRLARKYGSPVEFRGLEPITEPMERKNFRKEYMSGVVGKYQKLLKRKAKKKDEEVDIPSLLQRFASKHAEKSAIHAKAVGVSDAKDAEAVFMVFMDSEDFLFWG